ncbi:hypothetical protein ACKW6Q_20300 [Chryseobacterium kwangjuense]|uniref:Maltose/maltodextrin transport system permease protein n=1 Tax=Chryseobacterium kwangjuense TaxID=267125 RepID=A0ABW9K7L7_9FLAO
MKNRDVIIAYIIITSIFIIGVILSFNRYSFAGYYTDKVINWLWLASTLFTIIWFWKKKAAKIYGALLVSFVCLSIVPMAIPFFGIVYYFSTIDDFQQIQLDAPYRIERTIPAALSRAKILVYKNEGLLERQVYETPYEQILERKFPDLNNINLPIQNATLVDSEKDSLGIEYRINNKKKVFYHKENNPF